MTKTNRTNKKNQGPTLGQTLGLLHSDDCRLAYAAFHEARKILMLVQEGCPCCQFKRNLGKIT